MPDSFDAYTIRSGAHGDHSGRNGTGARKRCSQGTRLMAREANRRVT